MGLRDFGCGCERGRRARRTADAGDREGRGSDPHVRLHARRDAAQVRPLPGHGRRRGRERHILAELAHLAPDIPVVSEESEPSSADVRTSFFLVDPLDGTSEFLAGRNEYTVNIALVRDAVPVVGLVAAPALGIVWRGVVGRGAERLEFAANEPKPRDVARIRTRAWPADERVAAVSRSHYEAASAEFLARFAPVRTLSCGSALKFARVAEGRGRHLSPPGANLGMGRRGGPRPYPAAGGAVTTPEGTPLTYGAVRISCIPGFVAWGDPRAVIAA